MDPYRVVHDFVTGALAFIGGVWLIRRLRSALRWFVGVRRPCRHDPNRPGCED